MMDQHPLLRIRAESNIQPLDMLLTCHEKVDYFLNLLLRLHSHLSNRSPDSQTKEAAQRIIRYFTTAAQHHHEDEEQDLFPALLEAMAGSDAQCIRAMIVTLTKQHHQLNQLWDLIHASLSEISNGKKTLLNLGIIQRFNGLYANHIEMEEKELFPIAKRILTDSQMAHLQDAMVKRRIRP